MRRARPTPTTRPADRRRAAQRAFHEALGSTAAESVDGDPLRTFVTEH